MSLKNLPKIVPSRGAVYAMALLLGTFTFFYTKSVPRKQSSS